MDRFRVRPELAQRLAESFETALKLSNGTARVVFGDEAGAAPLAFSSRHACPGMRLLRCRTSSRACSPSTTRPAPAPAATASACRPSSIRNASYRTRNCRSRPARCAAGTGTTSTISSCCRVWRVTTNSTSTRPGRNCPSTVREHLLYGSEGVEIEFRYNDARGSAQRRRHAFEGIMPNLERRWRESDSGAVREELGRYRGTRPCPVCKGTRLNEVARAVLIQGRNIAEITQLTVGQAVAHFGSPAAAGLARDGRRPHRARSQRTAALPGRCGPGLPRARSRRRHALGRRDAAHPAREPGRLGTHRRDVHPR